MESPPYRRTERVCAGLYALLVAGSVLVVGWGSNSLTAAGGEPVPADGVAFLAVGLFWLCVLVAVATAGVVVAVNLRRRWAGHGADPVTEGAALAVLGCLAAATVATFGFDSVSLAVTFAFVALVVAPAALLAAAWGDRFRIARSQT